MFAADLVKDVSGRASASVGHVIPPLADAFPGIGAGGDVEQSLIGCGVLHLRPNAGPRYVFWRI
jgi:hypothetical protein